MSEQEFFNIKIGSVLYNRKRAVVCTTVSGFIDGATRETVSNPSVWTRKAYSEIGFNPDGAGDISINDCADWEFCYSDAQMDNPKIEFQMLKAEVSVMRHFLQNNFSQYRQYDETL